MRGCIPTADHLLVCREDGPGDVNPITTVDLPFWGSWLTFVGESDAAVTLGRDRYDDQCAFAHGESSPFQRGAFPQGRPGGSMPGVSR